MENISANNEIRFRVNPHAQDANKVMARVMIMATPTTADSRSPMVKNTSSTTADVAKINLKISVLDLSPAVLP